MSFKFNLKKRAKGRFSVRMRSYAIEDRKAAGKPDVEYIEKTLPEHEWARYGFDTRMSYDEASEHLKSLNSQARDRDIKEKKARFKYIESEEKKALLKSAYLPEAVVTSFEKKLENDSYSSNFKKSKTYFHWKTALKVISELDMPPSEWADSKRSILKKIEGYAPSTISKILNLMNSYGVFYSKKMGHFFERLTMPRGAEVGRISDKYLDKTGGKTKEAKGVTLADMRKLKDSEALSIEEYNWCAICLGLALRPSEMDSIAKGEEDFIEVNKNRVKIYQSKLVSLPRNQRYKEVLITHPFQKEAVKLLKDIKAIKKPSIKKLRAVLGEGYGLYSFRKGYTDIMLGLKEDITRISSDLGHSSIDRTWRSYRKKIIGGDG